MLGKNLLWVAKQHGHSVEVMLRICAAWLDGATGADIHLIERASGRRLCAIFYPGRLLHRFRQCPGMWL
jgi:hypothetical protein